MRNMAIMSRVLSHSHVLTTKWMDFILLPGLMRFAAIAYRASYVTWHRSTNALPSQAVCDNAGCSNDTRFYVMLSYDVQCNSLVDRVMHPSPRLSSSYDLRLPCSRRIPRCAIAWATDVSCLFQSHTSSPQIERAFLTLPEDARFPVTTHQL